MSELWHNTHTPWPDNGYAIHVFDLFNKLINLFIYLDCLVNPPTRNDYTSYITSPHEIVHVMNPMIKPKYHNPMIDTFVCSNIKCRKKVPEAHQQYICYIQDTRYDFCSDMCVLAFVEKIFTTSDDMPIIWSVRGAHGMCDVNKTLRQTFRTKMCNFRKNISFEMCD